MKHRLLLGGCLVATLILVTAAVFPPGGGGGLLSVGTNGVPMGPASTLMFDTGATGYVSALTAHIGIPGGGAGGSVDPTNAILANLIGARPVTNMVNLPHALGDYYADKPIFWFWIGDQAASSYWQGRYVEKWRAAGLPINGGFGISSSYFSAFWDPAAVNVQTVFSNSFLQQWELSAGSVLTNYSSISNNILANRITLAAKYGPNQGVITLFTGRLNSAYAPLASVDLSSAGWGLYTTNWAVPTDVYSLQWSNVTSGTESNIVLMTGAYKTNGAGLIVGIISASGTDMASQWTQGNTNIIWPLFRSIPANMIGISQLDYGSVTNGARWAMTNVLLQVNSGGPHDIVLEGHFPVHNSIDVRGQNAFMRDLAAQYAPRGARYFDLHPPGWGTNTMVENGFMSDAVHTSTAGGNIQADMWVDWSGMLPQLFSGDITNRVDHQIVAGTLSPRRVAASSLVRTDSSQNLEEVTVGSGLNFDGTTLTATGGGSGGGEAITNLVNLPTAQADYYADKPVVWLWIGDQVASSYWQGRFVEKWRAAGFPIQGGLGISSSYFTAGWDATVVNVQTVFSNSFLQQWEIPASGVLTNYSSISNNILANRITLAAKYGPNQGVITLFTGRLAGAFAPLASVDLSSAGWGLYTTNWAVPTDVYSLQWSNNASGSESNIVLLTGAYKTNGAGLVVGLISASGTDMASQWTLGNTNIIWPLFQSIDANLIGLSQLDYGSVTNGLNWAMTNALLQVGGGGPHDIVLEGHFPVHNGIDVRGQNAVFRDVAGRYAARGARYFDLHPPGWGTNTMVKNGWMSDAVHTSTAGANVQADMFAQWSGFLPQLISGDVTQNVDHLVIAGTLSALGATFQNAVSHTRTNLGVGNASLNWNGPREAYWFPNIDATLSFVNTPAAGTPTKFLSLTILANGATNITFPSGIDWGIDAGPVFIFGQTNRYVFEHTGSNIVAVSLQIVSPIFIDETGLPRVMALEEEMVTTQLATPALTYGWSAMGTGHNMTVTNDVNRVGTLYTQCASNNAALAGHILGASRFAQFNSDEVHEIVFAFRPRTLPGFGDKGYRAVLGFNASGTHGVNSAAAWVGARTNSNNLVITTGGGTTLDTGITLVSNVWLQGKFQIRGTTNLVLYTNMIGDRTYRFVTNQTVNIPVNTPTGLAAYLDNYGDGTITNAWEIDYVRYYHYRN